MTAVAANTIVAGDVLTEDGGTVLTAQPADVLGGEPTGCTALHVHKPTVPVYRAFYPNAQNVSLSNR